MRSSPTRSRGRRDCRQKWRLGRRSSDGAATAAAAASAASEPCHLSAARISQWTASEALAKMSACDIVAAAGIDGVCAAAAASPSVWTAKTVVVSGIAQLDAVAASAFSRAISSLEVEPLSSACRRGSDAAAVVGIVVDMDTSVPDRCEFAPLLPHARSNCDSGGGGCAKDIVNDGDADMTDIGRDIGMESLKRLVLSGDVLAEHAAAGRPRAVARALGCQARISTLELTNTHTPPDTAAAGLSAALSGISELCIDSPRGTVWDRPDSLAAFVSEFSGSLTSLSIYDADSRTPLPENGYSHYCHYFYHHNNGGGGGSAQMPQVPASWLGSALRALPMLKRLALSDVRSGVAAAIGCDDSATVSDDLAHSIHGDYAALRALSSLSLGRMTITPSLAHAVCRANTITDLSLTACACDDNTMSVLVSCSTLTSLSLVDCTGVGPETCRSLASISSAQRLVSLRLDDCDCCEDFCASVALAVVAAAPTLTSLALACSRPPSLVLDDALARVFPKLVTASISGAWVTDATMAAAGASVNAALASSLESLHISRASASGTGFRAIAQTIARLTAFAVCDCGNQGVADAIAEVAACESTGFCKIKMLAVVRSGADQSFLSRIAANVDRIEVLVVGSDDGISLESSRAIGASGAGFRVEVV